MTNEYDSNFPNDFNSRMVQSQNNKDFGLIQATLLDNHNLCSQNQISTPPTSPFLYASYESSLSCDTSFSSCSSSSLSPILTPTTSYPTLNSNPSLPTSPLEISLVKMEQDYEHSNDLSSHLYNNPLVQKQISITTSNELLSYEQYNNNNNIKDNAFNIKTTTYIQNINNQQLNQQIQYYIKEQSRILSLIEIQQQQYLKCKEFNDEQYKIDPEFLNSNLNLFKWTFIKPKFPLLFDQMYDKANGCFFLTGIPVEFIFDLCKHDNQQDLLTEDFLPFDNSNNEL